MENSTIDGSIEPVATESKIPMILAIAAFVLGGLSFVFAWNTKSNLTRHKDSIIKEVNDAVEVAKQAAADARNGGVSNGNVDSLKTDVEELKAMVKSEYATLSSSVNQLISHAKLTQKRLDKLEGGNAPPAQLRPATLLPETPPPNPLRQPPTGNTQ